MSLKIFTTTKTDLHETELNRIDAKYYLVNQLFDELEQESSYEVLSLDTLNAKISSGSYIDSYVNSTKGIPYIRVGNIKPFATDEQLRGLVFVSKEVAEKIKLKLNDIVVARTQATVEKLGVSSIIDEHNEGFAISQHVSKISINPKVLSPYYLVGYLNSKFFKAQTALASHGDTRVEMTHAQLKQVRVLIPDETSLKRIEAKVKIIIENNRKAIKLIREAQEIIEQEIDLIDQNKEKFFEVDLSTIKSFGIWNARSHLPEYVNVEYEITRKFKTLQLGYIADVKKGLEVGSDNYKTDLFRNKGDYAFIRTSDVTNNEIDMFPDYFIEGSIIEDTDDITQSGEILFTKDGVIGEVAIVSQHDRIIAASGFARIKLNKKAKEIGITPEYLFAILSVNQTGFYPAIRRTVIASTIPHLREQRLKEIKIPIFDLGLIEKITLLVKESFHLKDERKQLINEVREEIDTFFDEHFLPKDKN